MSIEPWKCCGCGAESSNGEKPCDCTTIVGFKTGGEKCVFKEKASEQPDEMTTITNAWLLLKQCEGENMQEDWPRVDAAYKLLEKAVNVPKREVEQPVGCREAFEKWWEASKDLIGVPDDAFETWTVWQAAWQPKREISNLNKGEFMLTDEQIEHMTMRFLGWKLPADFRPDCGIHFDAEAAKKLNPNNATYEPNGTNLFDYMQAKNMVRYMAEGLPLSKIESIIDRIGKNNLESHLEGAFLNLGDLPMDSRKRHTQEVVRIFRELTNQIEGE